MLRVFMDLRILVSSKLLQQAIWTGISGICPRSYLISIQTDIDLKKAAKTFANKFACGSSVVKNNQGNDEIVVQGDVSDDLEEFIPATWKNVSWRFLRPCEWRKFATRIKLYALCLFVTMIMIYRFQKITLNSLRIKNQGSD